MTMKRLLLLLSLIPALAFGQIEINHVNNTISTGGTVMNVNNSLAYGSLEVEGNAATTSTAVINTWSQFTGYDTNGISNGTTPDNTTDDITIDVAQKFLIIASPISFISSATNGVYEIAIFKNNGATQLCVPMQRKIGTGSDVGSGSITCEANLSLNDTVELWVRRTDTGGGTVTIQNTALSVTALTGAGSAVLTANTTVNFTSGMSSATIQGLIDAQPKNLGGHTLTFQYGDGTYNTSMTAAHTYQDFYGGTMVITGNTADTAGKNTLQSVFLDFSAGTSDGIYVNRCFAQVQVKYLKIQVADSGSVAAIKFTRSFALNAVWWNYLLAPGKTASPGGIMSEGAHIQAYQNLVSNLQNGLYATTGGYIQSNDNNDTGTLPNVGLLATDGGHITKTGTEAAGSQPTGSTANESSSNGGVIE